MALVDFKKGQTKAQPCATFIFGTMIVSAAIEIRVEGISV
jgi:hypothetical protein